VAYGEARSLPFAVLIQRAFPYTQSQTDLGNSPAASHVLTITANSSVPLLSVWVRYPLQPRYSSSIFF
jgi:hypothetical protein